MYNVSQIETRDMMHWPEVIPTTYTSAGYLEMFIVAAFFYWLLHIRIRTLIEAMSLKVYEAYRGCTEPSLPFMQSSVSLHRHLTQYQLKKREQLEKSRTDAKQQIEDALYITKQTPYEILNQCLRRPNGWLACAKCSTESRNNVPKNEPYPVIDVLKTGIRKRAKGYIRRFFATINHCLTFKGYNYNYIYQTVLQDEVITDVIQSTALDVAKEQGTTDEREFNVILKKQRDRAVDILNLMHAKLSNFVLRVSSWVFYNTLPILFKCITIPREQIEMLKTASERGLPMIFLPLHRSHLDYIAVTFTLCNNNFRAPLVAAGENLRIPFFGRVLRGLGAFFIKRRMDPACGRKDTLYRAILHTYMTQCLQAGHNFEFFIEGGRTRTGKPCMPKGGLLSVFVDAYLSGMLDDALLVPVSVNYEKLVEGNFVHEQTGIPKAPESFTSAVRGIWKALTSHYGIVRVDFNQPFSLHEFVKSFQNNSRHLTETLHTVPSTSSLYGTGIVVEDHRQLVDSMARHILYDCSQSTAVMSTNALAFLLLNIFRDGVNMCDLTLALDKLRFQLSSCNKGTAFCGESLNVIEHAISLMGPGLVTKEKTADGIIMVKPVTVLPNVIELAYYSNTVLPHFALDAVVGRVMMSLTKQHVYNTKLKNELIIDTCYKLCDILQYEFLFTKACQSLNEALGDILDRLVLEELLDRTDPPRGPTRGRRQYEFLDDSEDDGDDDTIQTVSYTIKDKDKLKLYAVLFDSLIETYSVTFNHLFSLVGIKILEEDLVKEILSEISSRIDLGVIRNGESLSTDTIRNSIKLLEKWKILECFNENNAKVYYISESYESELALEPIVERISKFQEN